MQNKRIYYSSNIYSKLEIINGKKFTPREIDVLAVLLTRKPLQKLSKILEIEIRGIESHMSNIRNKLDVVSRESIVEFLERSNKLSLLKIHCSALENDFEFRKKLKKIKTAIGKQNLVNLIIHGSSQKSILLLIEYLEFYLEIAGIKTLVETREEDKLFQDFEHNKKHPHISRLIYILDNSVLSQLEKEDVKAKIAEYHSLQKTNMPVFLLFEANSVFPLLNNIGYVDFNNINKFYFSILELIQKLLPNFDLNSIISEFNNLYKLPDEFSESDDVVPDKKLWHSIFKMKKNLFITTTIIAFVLALGIGLHLSQSELRSNDSIQPPPVRSDLVIPVSNAFLERSDIVKQMDKHLKGENGIQAVALVGIIGIGGAGKTTLARYYGHLNKEYPVVWEVNGETKNTLLNSFQELAYHLAYTGDMKKNLDFIEKISIPETKEKLLINFVKTALKARKNWILIYDNIEDFAQISNFFPHNSNQWGNGKVIITTRNEHISETSYIKPADIIRITNLSEHEMLSLFSKILYEKNALQLTELERKNTIEFLKNIPPFPLDVSVAAYSIKNTHVTFEQYLNHIKEYSKDYDTIQIRILKETTQYSKTRYGIISSTIEKLNNTNPDFKELFFLLCIIDSQDIPYELLKNYKNVAAVDNFIHYLGKNGLLLRESYVHLAKDANLISLHRSTQDNGLVYLSDLLNEKEKERLIDNAVQAVKKFYQQCAEQKRAKDIIFLIPHIKALIGNIHKINIAETNKTKYEADLFFILGCAQHKYARNLANGREYYKKALEQAKNISHFPSHILANLLKDLGITCVITNHPQEAIEYCKKSLLLCETIPNSELLKADNLQNMGASYRKLNNFQEALSCFNKALKLIPDKKDQDLKNLKAEIYTQLGLLYLMKYINKKEAQIAEKYDEEALKVLGGFELYHIKDNKTLPINITCNLARCRWKYSQVFMFHYGNYDTALVQGLREAEYIMEKKCPEDFYLRGRISGTMGEALLRKNNPLEAEERLTESINLISIMLGAHSTWVENVMRAEARIRLKKFKEAYEDCLAVLSLTEKERNNWHDLTYWTSSYHAALSKYKLGEYQKSIEHFANFFKNMQLLCKGFLDQETYTNLVQKGSFIVMPYSKGNALKNIKLYLHQVLDIFTAIYDSNHPFVKDYIAKNVV